MKLLNILSVSFNKVIGNIRQENICLQKEMSPDQIKIDLKTINFKHDEKEILRELLKVINNNNM